MTEGATRDASVVLQRRGCRIAGDGVPYARAPIVAYRDDVAAIGAERSRAYGAAGG